MRNTTAGQVLLGGRQTCIGAVSRCNVDSDLAINIVSTIQSKIVTYDFLELHFYQVFLQIVTGEQLRFSENPQIVTYEFWLSEIASYDFFLLTFRFNRLPCSTTHKVMDGARGPETRAWNNTCH